MPLQLNDRVKETSTTTGTVPFVLAGASIGYQSIASSISSSNTFPYVIELTGGSQWEIGIGTYVSGNNSLIRNQVLGSSNSGNLVDFLSGSKNVFITVPAAYTALTAKTLSQFASTTSAELASIISDETGSGKLVFSNNAILVTPDIGRANGTTLTLSGDLSVSGNVYLSGNVTTLSSNNLSVNDSLIYLAQDNPANLQDIGIVGHFTSDHYQHTGIVRDATDGVWKLFSNVSAEPSTTIDFSGNVIYDTLQVGSIITSNAVFSVANGSMPFSVVSNTLVSNLNADLLDGQHGTYYTGLSSSAFGQANSAYNQANTGVTIGQAAFSQANSAYTQANSGVIIGLGAISQANSAFTQANTGVTIGQAAFTQANSAYTQANTAVAIGQGAFGQANSGFNQANSAYNQANTAVAIGQGSFGQANSAYTQANTGVTIGQTAYAQANSAYAQANTGISIGQGAFGQANAAYTQANTGVSVGQAAYAQANTAYITGNNSLLLAQTKVTSFYQNTSPTTSNTKDAWIHSDTGVKYENLGNTSSPIWIECGPTGVANNLLPGIVNATSVLAANVTANSIVSSNITANSIISSNGVYSTGTYTGSYTDGIVLDYVNGNGRISVGANDGINFYSGGVGANTLLNITSSGQIYSTYNGANASAILVLSGNNTVGGTNYFDFLRVTNSASGATNPSKTLRLNVTGGLEIIDNAYANIIFQLSNSGLITTTGYGLFAPNRPAFRVNGNGGAVSSTTTMTSNNWVVEFNTGNYLNGSTGIFTAPVAGLYQVNVVVRTNSNTLNGITQIMIIKTAAGGATSTQIMVEFNNNTSMNHAGGSCISNLAVGDTLKFVVSAGTISFDGNDNWSVAYIG